MPEIGVSTTLVNRGGEDPTIREWSVVSTDSVGRIQEVGFTVSFSGDDPLLVEMFAATKVNGDLTVTGVVGVSAGLPDSAKGIFTDHSVSSASARYAHHTLLKATGLTGIAHGSHTTVTNSDGSLPTELFGVVGEATHSQAGTVANVRAGSFPVVVGSDSTGTNTYGAYASASILGFSTVSTAGYFENLGGGGSATDRYGIYATMSGITTTSGMAAAGRFASGAIDQTFTYGVFASIDTGVTVNTIAAALVGIDTKDDAASWACALTGKLGWASAAGIAPDVWLKRNTAERLEVSHSFLIGGAFAGPVTTITATNYTVLATDLIIICDTIINAVTVDLPDASVTEQLGRFLLIKNSGAVANNAIIDPDSTQTIDGAGTLALADGIGVLIVCDGFEWWSFKG